MWSPMRAIILLLTNMQRKDVRDWPELEPCPLHADPGRSPAEEKPSAQVWVSVAEERPVTSAMQEREDTPLVSI